MKTVPIIRLLYSEATSSRQLRLVEVCGCDSEVGTSGPLVRLARRFFSIPLVSEKKLALCGDKRVARCYQSRGMARGFSLVEVSMAIGIISFGLVAVMGLLPVGLLSVKQSTEQAAAARVVDSIIEAIRSPSTNSTGDKVFVFDGKENAMAQGAVTWESLNLEGFEEIDKRRLSARAEILEMPSATSTGRAIVTVAWSAQANPSWDEASLSWQGASGSLVSGFLFLGH